MGRSKSMHLCVADVARAIFRPITSKLASHDEARSDPRLTVHASPMPIRPKPHPIKAGTEAGEAEGRTQSPDSILDGVFAAPALSAAPPHAALPSPLSPLDNVCLRYWCVFQTFGLVIDGHPRWDEEGVVSGACNLARGALEPSEVDYDNVTVRLVVCACFTLSFKHASDEWPPCRLRHPGQSVLTSIYHSLFLNIRTCSAVESSPDRLHRTIEHIEGQIVQRTWWTLFQHCVLSPAGRIENLSRSILLGDADATGATDAHHEAFLRVLRKMAGFLTVLVAVSESCDPGLVSIFQCGGSGGGSGGGSAKPEEALLLVCVCAMSHARPHVEVRPPSAVVSHCASADAETAAMAVRIASLFLSCSERLKFARVRKYAASEDEDASRMLREVVLERVLATLRGKV